MQTAKKLISVLLALSLLLAPGVQAWADTLTLPSELENIGEEAFAGDGSLDEVLVPEGVHTIGPRAFAGSSVARINLPDSLTFIAEDAFQDAAPTVMVKTKSYAWQWACDHGLDTVLIPALNSDYNFNMFLPVEDTRGFNVAVSDQTRDFSLSNWDQMKEAYGEDYEWSFESVEGTPLSLSWGAKPRSFKFEIGNFDDIPAGSKFTVKAALRWGETVTETVFHFYFEDMPLPESVSFDQDIRMIAGESYRATVSIAPADWDIPHFLYYHVDDSMSSGSVETHHSISSEPEAFYLQASEPGYYLARPRLVLGDNAAVLGDYFTVSALHGDGWYEENKGVPGDVAAALAADPALDGISARELIVEGIPLLEAYRNDGQAKPLVFILHGAGGDKSKPRFREQALQFAAEGFYSVAIDLAACGESDIGPIDAASLWNMTVRQLDLLVEYYSTVDQADTEHFGIWGLSFGGIISFIYVAHGRYTPNIIAPVEATPDLSTMNDGSTPPPVFDHGSSDGVGPILPPEELADFLASMQPMDQLEKLASVYIYAVNRPEDGIVGAQGCEKLKALLNPDNDASGKQLFESCNDGAAHGAPMPEYYEKTHAALRQVLLGAESGPFD